MLPTEGEPPPRECRARSGCLSLFLFLSYYKLLSHSHKQRFEYRSCLFKINLSDVDSDAAIIIHWRVSQSHTWTLLLHSASNLFIFLFCCSPSLSNSCQRALGVCNYPLVSPILVISLTLKWVSSDFLQHLVGPH